LKHLIVEIVMTCFMGGQGMFQVLSRGMRVSLTRTYANVLDKYLLFQN